MWAHGLPGGNRRKNVKSLKWMTMGCVLSTVAVVACAQAPVVAQEDGDYAVVARIGEDVITAAELEVMVCPSLVKLRQQIYDAKVAGLQYQIFERLVVEAATEECLTRADYMKKHVNDKVGEPDEDQIAQLMAQYRARLAPDDEQARQQVIGALNQQAQARLSEDLRKELFAKNDVVILLDPPRVEVALGEGTPMRGPLTAPVVLVEYTDYQCPYCTRIQPTINALRERYGDQLLHVFKNLPLPMHAQAQLAGEASLCAQDQGKFWEFHDWLFANQRNLSQETMVAQAGVLEMDTELFTACIDQKTYTQKVKDDMKEARSFGFTGTPAFLINGRSVTGAQPIEAFEAIIDKELTLKGIEVPPRPEPEAAEGQVETAQ